MKIKDLLEAASSGAVTSTASITSSPTGGGTNLLGGPEFKRPSLFKKGPKKKTENIVKRSTS